MARKLDKLRPFEEACRWVAQFNIKSYRAWNKFVKEHGLPPDIPKQPRQAYGRIGMWQNWHVWLGNTPEARMEQILQSIISIAFVNTSGSSENVYTIIVTPYGEEHIKKYAQQADLKIVKIYRIKATSKNLFLEYIQKLKSGYYGDAEKIILSNPIATFSDLDQLADYINNQEDIKSNP